MYKLVAVGFNDTQGQNPLMFAEKDATDVCKTFLSDQGPVAPGDAALLVGTRASRRAILDALAEAARSNPTYLAFFFSGHGNEEGFLVADGLFRYSELHRALSLIDAPYCIVILDVCKAASFLRKEAKIVLGAVPDVTWMDALGSATPGMRCFFSTGPDRLAGENHALENGRFTAGLLAGMRHGRAALEYRGSRFVSDDDAFNYARLHMRDVQRVNQIPEVRGTSGDFPMLRSEKHEWIGEASITRAAVLPHALSVAALISNRIFVKTRFRYQIVNSAGKVVHEAAHVLEPTAETQTFGGHILFDADWLKRDSESRLGILVNGSTRFWWRLEILDGAGDTLDEHWVRAAYPARM